MAVLARSPIGRSTRLLVLALLTAVGVAMIVPALAQPSRSGTGEVVAIRELEVKPGANLEEFERFVTGTYNPAWEGAVPGTRGYIARGDRGVHKGRYAFVLIFDSEKTRNAIFPQEGAGASERFMPLLERPLGLTKELDKYIEPGTFSVYTDYVALR
jgi:hypothetical protein